MEGGFKWAPVVVVPAAVIKAAPVAAVLPLPPLLPAAALLVVAAAVPLPNQKNVDVRQWWAVLLMTRSR